jgi:membrane-associated phospholipid phosphatase
LWSPLIGLDLWIFLLAGIGGAMALALLAGSRKPWWSGLRITIAIVAFVGEAIVVLNIGFASGLVIGLIAGPFAGYRIGKYYRQKS